MAAAPAGRLVLLYSLFCLVLVLFLGILGDVVDNKLSVNQIAGKVKKHLLIHCVITAALWCMVTHFQMLISLPPRSERRRSEERPPSVQSH